MTSLYLHAASAARQLATGFETAHRTGKAPDQIQTIRLVGQIAAALNDSNAQWEKEGGRNERSKPNRCN